MPAADAEPAVGGDMVPTGSSGDHRHALKLLGAFSGRLAAAAHTLVDAGRSVVEQWIVLLLRRSCRRARQL